VSHRSHLAARPGAAELAARRCRLPTLTAEADPTDALLFRAELTAHQGGLRRLAAAALSVPSEAPPGFPRPPLVLNRSAGIAARLPTGPSSSTPTSARPLDLRGARDASAVPAATGTATVASYLATSPLPTVRAGRWADAIGGDGLAAEPRVERAHAPLSVQPARFAPERSDLRPIASSSGSVPPEGADAAPAAPLLEEGKT
jgi:hypothetical protein